MSNNDKSVRRGIYLYIDDHEINNNVASITGELRRIQKEQEKMTIGSREYVEATAKIKNLRSVLAQHRAQLSEINAENKKGNDIVDKFNSSWQKFGNVITMGIAGLTGLTLSMKSFNDQKNELEESQHGLQALTGLDDESIKWLTDQAKELSTTMTDTGLRVRQSASEILQAYMLVGSNKPELLSDKEALNQVTVEVMRLAAASGMKLEGAVTAVTTAMNQFGASADQAAKFVNILAAGSKMGAADVQMQADAILNTGVAAKTAGLSIEELDGAIEMLGEMGIKGSQAGTYLNSFLMKLATGSRAAKLQNEGLSAVLKDLNDEFLAAEKNLAGSGMAAMNNEFSERGIRAAMVLSQNIEKFNEYTKAVTDTNIATEQAAINSDTAAASLAQIKNEINLTCIELAEKLNPALRVSTSSFSYIVKLLPPLIDFINKYTSAILAAGAAILTYYVRVKLATTLTAAWKAVTVAAEIAMLALSGRVASANIAMAAYITRVKAAITQTKLWNTLMKLNPWGLALASLTGLVVLAERYGSKSREILDTEKSLADAEERAKEKIEEQTNKFEKLRQKVNDTNLSLTERRQALDELKRMAPGYHATLTEEGKLINDNNEALDKANFLLQKNIRYQEAQNNYLEIQKRVRDQQGKVEMIQSRGDARLDFNLEEEKKVLEDLIKKREIYIKQLDEIRDMRYEPSPNKKNTVLPEIPEPDGGNSPTTPVTESETTKRIKRETDAIDAVYTAKQNQLKKRYAQGEIAEEEYQAQLQKIEIESLNKKLEIIGLEPKEREKINAKIQDLRIKALQALSQLETSEINTSEEKAEKVRQDTEKNLQKELLVLKNALENQIITQEDYEKKKELLTNKWAQQRKKQLEEIYGEEAKERTLAFERETDIVFRSKSITEGEEKALEERRKKLKAFYQELLQDTRIGEKDRTEILSRYNQITVEELEDSYDEIKEKNSKLFDSFKSLGQDLGEEIADFITSTEVSLGDLAKNVAKLMLNTLEKVLAEAIAERTIKNIATLGFAGIAKAAAEIAAITAAFETAKGIIGNFWTGGYTGPGKWDEPKGTVHAGEFVANRFAVGNSDIKPVLDLIDHAQKSGNVSRLTSEDITAVANHSAPSRYADHNTVNDAVLRNLALMQASIKQMQKKMDHPLLAVTSVTGKYGSLNTTRLYDKMIENKNRR